MIKLRVKETATNLVYFYSLDTIKTVYELGRWFGIASHLNDLTIRRVQLIDSSGRNSEGAGSTEIDFNAAQHNLHNCMRETHADTVSISTLYKGVSIVIDVNCNDWTLSMVANKKDKDALDGLENIFTTMLEMANHVREAIKAENATPVEEVAEPQKAPTEQTELFAKLDAVQQALATLQQTFDDKIVETIALDIIQLVDTTKSNVRAYDKKEPTEENYKKLLKIVKGIAKNLQEILSRQNIESYRVTGHEVDVRRQKIIQTMPTDDKSKDNLVAVRVADGYEKGDKILRPEKIKTFKYEEPSETPSEN